MITVKKISFFLLLIPIFFVNTAQAISPYNATFAIATGVVAMANEDKYVENKSLPYLLENGWHYGFTRCIDIEEGLYCCLKREVRETSFPHISKSGKCLKAVPFDEIVKIKARKKGFEYKIIGISYITYYDDVLIYYIWKKKENKQ